MGAILAMWKHSPRFDFYETGAAWPKSTKNTRKINQQQALLTHDLVAKNEGEMISLP